MGRKSSFLTRVTTDDYASSTTTEEESIALAIAALQSMPQTSWRNRVNHPQSNSCNSSKRPRSATQAAMKTKCPTRFSVSPKLPNHPWSSPNKKAKHSMVQSRLQPQQQQEPTTVASSTHKSAWNVVPAEAVLVDPQQPTEDVVPSPHVPCEALMLPTSDTIVPSVSHSESHQPARLPQSPSSSAPPCYYESKEPQRQEQQDEQDEDSTQNEQDDNHQTSPRSTDHSPATTRLARCRERNREHARKTRLRKKAALQELQTRSTTAI